LKKNVFCLFSHNNQGGSTISTLSLQQRIFFSVGVFVALTVIVVWFVIRPEYEKSVLNERTTILQQIQHYAVRSADERFSRWVNSARYLAFQAEMNPGELDIAMRQTIGLNPSIVQFIVTSQDIRDELVVTNTDYPSFSYEPDISLWRPYRIDSTTLVQLTYDSASSMLLLASRTEFRLGKQRFTLIGISNANDVRSSLASLPVDGVFGSILRDDDRTLYSNTAIFNTVAIESGSNVTLLRSLELNGQRWIVLSAEFSSVPYTSSIIIPESLFLQPVRQLFYYSAFFIVGLVSVVAALGWIVSHQISKPVRILVDEVQRLSTLDFSTPISPVTLPDLAIIGTTIESMRISLERYRRINVEKIIFEEWKNRFFLSHSQDMIALTDPDGSFLFMNDRFSTLRSELTVGAPVIRKEDLLTHPSIRPSKETTASESSGGFNITVVQKDLSVDHSHGTLQFLRFHDVTIRRGEEHLGSLLTLHDMTNERMIEQMKKDMMSVIAHELRNPLNSVIGFASLMIEEEQFKPDETKKYLDIIRQSGRTMNTLITRFLDVQRLESGKGEYPKEETDIAGIVDLVCLSQKPLLKQKSLELKVTKEELLPPAVVSPELIREAVLNLVSNAIKYGDENRTIEVDLKRHGNAILLSVTDHGYGISAEDQEKLFSKFFRVTSNKKAAGQVGTGLGLSHVKEVMKFHGGDVSLESHPAIGSRFTLTIPLNGSTS
jgi:signal transduction histidine kinase/PAS domain-containing protein